MKKIGILTGGGDCPGLNAVIRSVVERCAMIRDFGDKTKDVLEIWSRIKGDNLGVGITILIFVVVGVMSGWMIYKRIQRYKHKKMQRRRSRRRKKQR